MKKLVLVTLIAIVAACWIGLRGPGTVGDAHAAKPCMRKKFETVLIKDACQRGGQDEAKKQMKTFLKEAKKRDASVGCATCHAKVGGDYPLKKDGLKTFRGFGGK